MKKILAFLFILPFFILGQTDLTKDWEKLKKEKFVIQYPKTWTLDESGQFGSTFILFSEQESKKDNFRENVNLLIQDLTGMGIDLDKYSAISEEQVKTLIVDSKLLESSRLENETGEFQKVIYTGNQKGMNLYFQQYYWVKNSKAYVLTFTSEQSELSKFKDIGENILSSFKFK